jgi:hypothetical protein
MDEDEEHVIDEETTVTNFTELKNYLRDDIIIQSYKNALSYFKEKKDSLKKCFQIKNDVYSGLI